MAILHELDVEGKAYTDGERAEKSFANRFFDKFGIYPMRTDEYRDKYEHIDYEARLRGHIGTWDVKSIKRWERNDSDYMYDKVWVEFVSKGYLGWLYGKADWVAFELEKDGRFICVKREELLEYCEEHCRARCVVNARDAMWNLYVRRYVNDKGEKVYDMMSLIDRDALFLLENWIL